jgi:hypothetical protein
VAGQCSWQYILQETCGPWSFGTQVLGIQVTMVMGIVNCLGKVLE